MNKLKLASIGLAFLLSSCAHKKNEYHINLNEAKPLQIIRLGEFSAIPAQGDKVVDSEDLNNKLALISPEFKQRTESAKSYQRWGITSFITSMVLLGVCGGSGELGWCLGSVALSYAGTRPLLEKSGKKYINLFEDYNRRLE